MMNKFKPSIIKKKLSWENHNIKYDCDYRGCSQLGKYKAPKSRSNLSNYYYFCIKHVKEYNKSWDFYKGLSIDQIEISMRKDAVWDRPSWPISGSPATILSQIENLLNNDFTLDENENEFKKLLKNRLINQNLTIEEQKSVDLLGIKMPINVDEIKKAYKKLVKIFHPDVNKNNKEAEKKFKEINEAYKTLLKKFLKNK